MPGKKVVTTINPETLSMEDTSKSLNAINLIKKNEMEQLMAERVLMGEIKKDT